MQERRVWRGASGLLSDLGSSGACRPWAPLAVAAPLGASVPLSVKSSEEKRVPTLGCSQSDGGATVDTWQSQIDQSHKEVNKARA